MEVSRIYLVVVRGECEHKTNFLAIDDSVDRGDPEPDKFKLLPGSSYHHSNINPSTAATVCDKNKWFASICHTVLIKASQVRTKQNNLYVHIKKCWTSLGPKFSTQCLWVLNGYGYIYEIFWCVHAYKQIRSRTDFMFYVFFSPMHLSAATKTYLVWKKLKPKSN